MNLDPYLPEQVEAFKKIKSEVDEAVRNSESGNGQSVGEHVPIILCMGGYGLKHNPAYCSPHTNAQLFGPYLEFVKTLPFKQTGRISAFLDVTPIHRDIPDFYEVVDAFIWMQYGIKGTFVVDPVTKQKSRVTSTFAWWDGRLIHGSEFVNGGYSMRVDGLFTPEFKERIGLTGKVRGE